MIRAIDPPTGNRNVLGGELIPCSADPMTGFYRTGCCETGPDDHGSHTVCVRVTACSKGHGNQKLNPG